MFAYAGHAGEALAVNPDTLMVGPALVFVARDILGNDRPQQLKGLAKLFVNPHINGDYANCWCLISCAGPIKPVTVLRIEQCAVLQNMPVQFQRGKGGLDESRKMKTCEKGMISSVRLPAVPAEFPENPLDVRAVKQHAPIAPEAERGMRIDLTDKRAPLEGNERGSA